MYKWTCAVQIHLVQRPTVLSFLDLSSLEFFYPQILNFHRNVYIFFFFCNEMHVRNTAIKKMYFYGCVYVSMSAFSMQFIYPILSMKHFPFEHVILLYYLHLITMSWFWHSIYHFLIKNLKHIRAVCIDIYTFEF